MLAWTLIIIHLMMVAKIIMIIRTCKWVFFGGVFKDKTFTGARSAST